MVIVNSPQAHRRLQHRSSLRQHPQLQARLPIRRLPEHKMIEAIRHQPGPHLKLCILRLCLHDQRTEIHRSQGVGLHMHCLTDPTRNLRETDYLIDLYLIVSQILLLTLDTIPGVPQATMVA